jgi:glycerophosphoryl diester phosphodiesterase
MLVGPAPQPLPVLATLAPASAPPVAEEPPLVPSRRSPRPFHVIAHRGASACAPENTLPAFSRALELGANEVELDAQLSRDGEPVLFHDDTLERKTGARGRVRDHDAAALGALDIGRWFDRRHPQAGRRFAGTGLATLDEAFAAVGARLTWHVELKSDEPELVERVLAIVRRHGLAERVALTSFQLVRLEQAHARAPTIPLCWLLRRGAREGTPDLPSIERAAVAGFRQVGVAVPDLDEGLVRAAHARGLEIRAWRVRSDGDVRRVFELGADGLTSDWPDRTRAELTRLGALS